MTTQRIVSKEERLAAYEKVFGGVNTAATKRVSAENALKGETPRIMREGKTANDKRNGHIAGKKNVRVWQAGSVGKKGSIGSTGSWVKR